ncbi:uncharacterized protein Z519_09283 [Cladophialophora bantiana CBS 173.52]|uniref:Uncharacterized protein n=1 Tax=Cladophialophora bantiana (strain ATCC 10958 / CBS 173.52 / CDC B-1940 / NIH 8579) TaxID=1442370 RepID=A0A0D2HZ26_CLAB1|nr:uncharacterized protein Z519_09283 [Cladophialophora bantiana CBS 173.52]KIW89854.1 hypothetical protein Z519_09283 [Cladophialophora bantiana CBS 173.52]
MIQSFQVFTSTSTITSQIFVHVTWYETSYATEIVTETVTNIDVAKASNGETATVVDATTVGIRMANRARHLLSAETAIPPSKSKPVALSTNYASSSSQAQGVYEDPSQNPITPFVEPSHGLRRSRLSPRLPLCTQRFTPRRSST